MFSLEDGTFGMVPANSTITNNNDGTASFNWTPSISQVGNNTFDVVVTDGTEPDRQTITVIVLSAPDAPTAIIATPISYNQIDLSWTAPANDGGSAIIGYMIERESPIGGGFQTIIGDTGSALTTYTNDNLLPETTYNYKISAINTLGAGTASNESDATTTQYGIVSVATFEPPNPATFQFFGSSVSVNKNNTDSVLVATPWDTSISYTPGKHYGGAYLFDSLTQNNTYHIPDPSLSTNSNFAYITEMLPNGLIAIPEIDVDIFDPDIQTLVRTLLIPSPNPNYSIDSHGADNLIIGNRLADLGGITDAGAAYVYDTTTGFMSFEISNPNPISNFNFGKRVASFDDGKIAVSGVNSVYVYDSSGSLLQTISDPYSGSFFNNFGEAIAPIGDNLLAISDNIESSGQYFGVGTVYIFDVTDGSLVSEIVNPDPNHVERFGEFLAVFDNDTKIAISQNSEDYFTNDVPVLYIFDIPNAKQIWKLDESIDPIEFSIGYKPLEGTSGNKLAVGTLIASSPNPLSTGLGYLVEFGSVGGSASAMSSPPSSSIVSESKLSDGLDSAASQLTDVNIVTSLFEKTMGLEVLQQDSQKLTFVVNYDLFSEFYSTYHTMMNEKNQTVNNDYPVPIAVSSDGSIWFAMINDKNQIQIGKSYTDNALSGYETNSKMLVIRYLLSDTDVSVTSDLDVISNTFVISDKSGNGWIAMNATSEKQQDDTSKDKIKPKISLREIPY